MKYKLNFDLNYFKVVKPTRENNDKIYMIGFGVNEFGEIDLIPLRRIYSNTVASFNPDNNPYDNNSDTQFMALHLLVEKPLYQLN